MSNNSPAKVSNNPFDIFVVGARKGFNIAINNLLPNVPMAYVIAEILNLLGIMALLGKVLAPIMGLFGLPGDAITVLLTSWLSPQRALASPSVCYPKGSCTLFLNWVFRSLKPRTTLPAKWRPRGIASCAVSTA